MIRYIFLKLIFLSPLFSVASLLPLGPLSLSQGGGGRAVSTSGVEYHLLNPAVVADFKNTKTQAFYVFSDDSQLNYIGLSVGENNVTPIALSFLKSLHSSEHLLAISTAGVIVPGWSLGVSFDRWQVESNTHWNVQTGLLIKPPGQKKISFAATWDFLLPLKGAFKKAGQKGALAIMYQLNQRLRVKIDGLYVFTLKTNPYWVMIGALESVLAQFLVLRGATSWNQLTGKFLFSGGLGLKGKTFHFDYGVSQRLEGWTQAINVRALF